MNNKGPGSCSINDRLRNTAQIVRCLALPGQRLSVFPSGYQFVRFPVRRPGLADSLGLLAWGSFGGQPGAAPGATGIVWVPTSSYVRTWWTTDIAHGANVPSCYEPSMTKPALDASGKAALAAQAWVEVCELLDLQLSPLGMRAIDALGPALGDMVVDIGCGAGQSTLQLAGRVGAVGRVVGVDIAAPLLDLARHRAADLPQVSFLQADAQCLDLPDQSADGIYSRFGVMAFADSQAAFGNFRRVLKPSGRLAFVCWRALEANELDFMPLQATGLEAMADWTPFSFADAEFLRTMLSAAGFDDIVVQAGNEAVSSGSLEAMATVLFRVGPLGRILRENPGLKTEAEPKLRAALADHEEHGVVALRAATWIVTACPRV